ncbi:MAG: PfkB family carbohydrate kinase [Oscillospiraceae bacterium]|nr:PfkB family carbohydrate kinase [Oscillospiraceae bacterium]
MKKILALSCCCVDYFPELGEAKAGGNALNLAANAKSTGRADAFLMGNIGTDEFGAAVIAKADEYGINHERLHKIKGETASNKIFLTESGDRYFKPESWSSGVYNKFCISSEDAAFMKTMDAVATTINDGLIEQIDPIFHDAFFLFAVDFMDRVPSDDWKRLFYSFDILFISLGEKPEYLPLLKDWSHSYNNIFVATLGEGGSVAYHDGMEYVCAAVKVPAVVDTTGCGDSYQGAFIVEYLHSRDISAAMVAGAKSAAKTLGFVGAIR